MRIHFVTSFLRTILITKLAACAGLVAVSLSAIATAAPSPFHYTVTVAQDLQSLRVHARFDRAVTSLSARATEAGDYLIGAQNCDDDAPLRNRGRRLVLPPAGITCLRYRVDLAAAASAERRNDGLSSANIIASPAVWLWRPSRAADITVRFDLPDAMRVAVPWLREPASPDTYRIPRAPGSSTAAAVFGEFDYAEADIAGATLRITVAKTNQPANPDALFDWVQAQASHVTLAYGRFPNPSPSVVVLAGDRSWRSDSPVRFGRVVRDGGESVELFVDRNMPVSSYYDNWIATHEFSHMMLPYLQARHRWISEGFAQYYQNVLLARAGQYSQDRAWRELYQGYERGRNSRPELSPNDAARDRRDATMKFYWSGAALALMADVKLRRQSGGEQSLDTVLGKLDECCLPAADMWSGPQLFEKLDTFLDEPIFMPLYRQYANRDGFPDILPLLHRLGVSTEDGAFHMVDDAELAELRRTITGG